MPEQEPERTVRAAVTREATALFAVAAVTHVLDALAVDLLDSDDQSAAHEARRLLAKLSTEDRKRVKNVVTSWVRDYARSFIAELAEIPTKP